MSGSNIPDVKGEVEGEIEQLVLELPDTTNAEINGHFESAQQFIDQAHKTGGRILVHCYAGISRSPTIVISYLMKFHGMRYLEALQFVLDKRSIVDPNLGFRGILVRYEKELFPDPDPVPVPDQKKN